MAFETEAGVQVNIGKLRDVYAGFDSLQRVPSSGPFEAMFNKWAKRYEAFTRRRYNQNAAGGGDWAPLALSTIKARTGGKGKNPYTKARGAQSQRTFLARNTRRGTLVASPRSYQILKDTGVLFGSLTIGGRNNVTNREPGRIIYGIGGSGERQMIALAHQRGVPSKGIPARPILVYPNQQTLRGMQRDATVAIQNMIRSGV